MGGWDYIWETGEPRGCHQAYAGLPWGQVIIFYKSDICTSRLEREANVVFIRRWGDKAEKDFQTAG